MIATGLVALLSIASAVVAQSTAAAGSPPNIPACLLTCTQKSCPTSDLTCICITHLTDITSCALASCSQADLALASTLAADQCANVGGASGSASSVVASHTSAIESAVSSIKSEISSEVSSVASKISSAVESASATKAAGSAGASGAGGAASATGTAAPPASGAGINKAGSLFGLVGVIAGIVAL